MLNKIVNKILHCFVTLRYKLSSKKILLLETKMHGSHYYECWHLLEDDSLKIGQKLVLHREKHCEYDEMAVEVITCENIKLGYIPRRNNKIIATLMAQNQKIDACITEINKTTWEPITIKVYWQK